MTQKMLDSLIEDAKYSIQYHQKKLIEAQATLAGLKQIIQEEVIITESQLNE
tara:strand:+ start:951 stop:1106 length:156 start_codon:yes stop_codon:yes gene_type:complete